MLEILMHQTIERLLLQENLTGTFSIPITDDSIKEIPESFTFTITTIGAKIADGSSSKTIKIIDDDIPTIDMIADSFVIAEDGGNFTARLTVSRALSQRVRFRIFQQGGTASNFYEWGDYNFFTYFGEFDSRTTERTMTVDIYDDSIVEDDETFTLVLQNLTLGNGQDIGKVAQFANGESHYRKTITIADDESRNLSFSEPNISVSEDTGNLLVDLDLSKTAIVDVTFDYELSNLNLTATNPSDYTNPSSLSGTITAGGDDATISIPITNDAIHELDETFKITLKNLIGGSFTAGAATISQIVTITDDDEPILVIPANPTPYLVAEDSLNDELILNLQFSKALLHPISVTIETTDDSALVGQDFVAFGSTPKEFRSTTDNLPVVISSINDSTLEGNESFSFRITSLSGAKFPEGVTSYSGTMTIIDDESSTLTITNTEFYVEEDVQGGNFDVNLSLSSAVDMDVTVEFNMEDVDVQTASKGTDYTQDSNNTITFEAGQTTKTLSIPITVDQNIEGNESFTLVLSSLIGAKFTDDASSLNQKITIFDDDAPEVTITADNFNVAEDAGKFTFSLNVDGTYTNFKFSLSTSHGTAMGTDFSDSFEDEYTYQSNATNPILSVDLTDDDDLEVSETFTISLVITEGAVRLPKGSPTYSKTVTIVDDESTTLSVKNTRFSVNENVGLGGFILRLGISQAIDVDVIVEYEADYIDPNTRSDFSVPAEGKVKILAGETLGTFTISINDDTEMEGNEPFRIILKDPIGADHASGNDTHNVDITIVDDEYPTVKRPRTGFFNEGTGEAEVEVELEGASTRLIAVSYETVDDTAIAGEDYTHTQGVLNFSPGSFKKKIKIPIIDDSDSELSELFNIIFTITIGDTVFQNSDGSANTTENKRFATTTVSSRFYITDNETPYVAISNTKFYVGEDVGSDGFKLEVALSRNTPISYNFAVTGGTAVAGVDYNVTTTGTMNHPGYIPGSGLSQIIDIGIEDNDEVDGNKTIRIKLSNLTGAVFAEGGDSITRTIIIVDDEPTTFSLSTTTFEVDENVSEEKIDISYMISPVSLFDISFKVATEDDTAIKGQDYTEVDQTITIEAGTTTGTFSIPILNDSDNEGEHSFKFKITDVVGAKIAENKNEIVAINYNS